MIDRPFPAWFGGQMTSLDALSAIAKNHVGSHAIPRFLIHKVEQPNELVPSIYEPCVCLILQGAKRTIIGGKELIYGAGTCLVVAAELSALGQVVEATPRHPFLAVALSLDHLRLSDAMRTMPGVAGAHGESYALETASDVLIEIWGRMIQLLDRPNEIEALSELYERELLYRLLSSGVGPVLRQIGMSDSNLARIRRTMNHIQQHHAERIEVARMAELSGMSLTSFHRRFKKVTGISPLQYQKQVRLHEAKRILIASEGSAASVAYRVGYESASQFSREYRRLFGMPPLQDAAAARELARVVGPF